MAATCVFCEIVAGDLAAHVVFDHAQFLAFLDTRPLFVGHTLVVPKAHHETLGDLPPHLVDPLFQRTRQLSIVVEETLGAAGSFVAMNNTVSQSVPHLHVHVVPRNPKDGLRGFFWPRTKYADSDHAAEVAATLADGFAHAFPADKP